MVASFLYYIIVLTNTEVCESAKQITGVIFLPRNMIIVYLNVTEN